MNRALSAGIAVSFLVLSANSFAESKFQVGGGFASQSVNAPYRVHDLNSSYDLEYNIASGGLFADGRYIFNDNVAIELALAFSSSGEISAESSSGGYSYSASSDIDGFRSTYLSSNVLLGTSLIRSGWYGYTGIGFFKDTWNADDSSKESFSGLQLPLGFGYNFSNVSLDTQFLFQSSDDYDKFFQREIGTKSNAGVVSFRLGLLADF